MADPQVPPSLDEMINLTIGNLWPQASPSRIRKVGDIYLALNADLGPASAAITKAMKSVAAAGQSAGLDAAMSYLQQIWGGQKSLLPDLFDQNTKINASAYEVALEYEYAQIM